MFKVSVAQILISYFNHFFDILGYGTVNKIDLLIPSITTCFIYWSHFYKSLPIALRYVWRANSRPFFYGYTSKG
jgi:hypothetical protein